MRKFVIVYAHKSINMSINVSMCMRVGVHVRINVRINMSINVYINVHVYGCGCGCVGVGGGTGAATHMCGSTYVLQVGHNKAPIRGGNCLYLVTQVMHSMQRHSQVCPGCGHSTLGCLLHPFRGTVGYTTSYVNPHAP